MNDVLAIKQRPAHRAAPILRWSAVAWTLLPIVAPLAAFAVWCAATRASSDSGVLVPPLQVFETLRDLVASGELPLHLGKSLVRLAVGFGVGAALGVPFGLGMGVSRRFESLFGPFFHAIRQIPSIAIIPMMILILGVEETFKVAVVLKASFFPVALGTADGVRGVPASYLEVARVLNLSRAQTVRRLLLPAAVPPIITGLRIALARSWMVLVAAELIAAESGLGQMMEMGRQMFRIDVVLVGVLITGLLGFLLDRGMRAVEARLAPWRRA
jgi:sulfonate transport system permease protein